MVAIIAQLSVSEKGKEIQIIANHPKKISSCTFPQNLILELA